MEIQYNQTNKNNKIQDFKNIIINAEKNARNKNKNSEDITIDEIYDEININKFDKEKVKSQYMLLGHNVVNIVAKNKDKTI